MSIRKGNVLISGKGSNGTNGTDGYSPIATVSKVGNTATISITDTNGTTTAQIYDGDTPEIITSQASTYTIDSLTANKSYKLGELSSLTITATTTFDIETVIYFSSGSTGTSISIPSSLVNLNDVPTLTETSGVNSGTCETNKNYIISVLNNIAIWKAY